MSNQPGTEWVVAYASARGHLHVEEDMPCQDSVRHRALDYGRGVVVLADGAGSARHSEVGSDKVTAWALERFVELMETEAWLAAASLPTAAEWQRYAAGVLASVREELAAFAERQGWLLQELACTVIVLLYGRDFVQLAHVGDGRAAWADAEGQWRAALVPYRGEEANETVFLTSLGWEEAIQAHQYAGEAVSAFVAMTDGCEKSAFEMNLYDEATGKYHDPNRPFAPFLNPNVAGLRALRRDGKSQAEINALWGRFLEGGTRHFQQESDDKTMALGARTSSDAQV